MNPKSIILDHCWVCGVKFVAAGGAEVCHHHHMVPRAFGGVDGPTVSICDTHHSKLHRIAECLTASKPYFSFLVGEDSERRKKLIYLASIVHNAELAAKNDPNKAATVLVTLNAHQKAMLDRLKAIYPSIKSRPALMALALDSLYKKHFTK